MCLTVTEFKKMKILARAEQYLGNNTYIMQMDGPLITMKTESKLIIGNTYSFIKPTHLIENICTIVLKKYCT